MPTKSSGDIDCLEQSIADGHLKYYEDFKNIESIGKGSSGSAVRANWKNTDQFFVLKSFKNDKIILKEIIKELKLHQVVNSHENILQFYGVTKVEETDVNKYSLVLEYADGGTLKTYLSEHFNELNWSYKYQLAWQLASAVAFIHEYSIIHRDLNDNNIFIHRKNIKLSLLKRTETTSSNTLPYVDPKGFNNHVNQLQNYELDKKSDVYSVGVLMWQISSGHRPFYGESVDFDLEIVNGKREKIIDGTPIEYSNLYQECWRYEPDKRPDMQKVSSTLKAIIFPEHDIIIDGKFENNQLKKRESTSKSINSDNSSNVLSRVIVEKLIEFVIKKHDEGINFNQITSLVENQILQRNQTSNNVVNWLMKHQTRSKYFFFLGFFSYHNIGMDEINYGDVDAFKLFLEAANNNYLIAQVYLAKCFYDRKQYESAFNWYQKSATNGSVIGKFYLGYCYKVGIGTVVNKKKEFYLFKKAAQRGHSMAQYNLGKLYDKSESTKMKAVYWFKKAEENGNEFMQYNLGKYYQFIDNAKSFDFYKKSADKGFEKAQYKIGIFYEIEIGTIVDNKESFRYYKMAADKGFVKAIFKLGYCYYEGVGVVANKEKAFQFYREAAEKGDNEARNSLGVLYLNGEGIEKNLLMAFYWFEKAADKGHSTSQYNLGLLYLKNEGVEKNLEKAFYWFQKASDKGYSSAQCNLGILYLNGKGTEENLEMAFYWFKKAAKNGYERGQYCLGICYEYGKGVEKNEIKALEFYKRSADKGFVEAKFKIGYYYDKGIRIVANKEKAFQFYKEAAEKGCIEAQNSLGLLYLNGEGTEKDPEVAFYWFQKAAEKGCENAQYNLGVCQFGKGTDKNENKASELYKEAAEKGHSVAQNNLGTLYLNGEGTEKNLEMGNEFAQNKLDMCYELGMGVDKDQVKAFDFYKKSAEGGFRNAQFHLGFCYTGVDVDKEKAICFV